MTMTGAAACVSPPWLLHVLQPLRFLRLLFLVWSLLLLRLLRLARALRHLLFLRLAPPLLAKMSWKKSGVIPRIP